MIGYGDEVLALRSALCATINQSVDLRIGEGEIRAVMPGTDPNGDPFVFVVEGASEARFITDAGLVYHYLVDATGVSDPRSELWDRVAEIARRYAFDFNAGEINREVTGIETIAESLLTLSSISAEACGLARTHARPVVTGFDEEVEHFLRESSIPFRPDQTVIGASSAPLKVDFILESPQEMIAQAIGSENSMRRAINIFYDLTERSEEYLPVAFVDEARSYSNVTFAQLSHKANVFFWDQRPRFLEYWHEARDIAARPRGTHKLPFTDDGGSS